LAKAKAAKPLAEKLVTLGKTASLHSRRLALAKIGQREAVTKLFSQIAPGFKQRIGGYTRIIKLGPRQSDSAPVAFLEWVEFDVEAQAPTKDESSAVEVVTTPVEPKESVADAPVTQAEETPVVKTDEAPVAKTEDAAKPEEPVKTEVAPADAQGEVPKE
jgi:large subunit ribosomal protein L17